MIPQHGTGIRSCMNGVNNLGRIVTYHYLGTLWKIPILLVTKIRTPGTSKSFSQILTYFRGPSAFLLFTQIAIARARVDKSAPGLDLSNTMFESLSVVPNNRDISRKATFSFHG